jgi:hypothetical protein
MRQLVLLSGVILRNFFAKGRRCNTDSNTLSRVGWHAWREWRVLVRMIGFISALVAISLNHTQIQEIQRYRWFTHFPFHRCTRTRIWQLRSCFCGAPTLTRGRVCLLYMLLALASAVFLGSVSLGTRDHMLLSQIWDFPSRRLWRVQRTLQDTIKFPLRMETRTDTLRTPTNKYLDVCVT